LCPPSAQNDLPHPTLTHAAGRLPQLLETDDSPLFHADQSHPMPRKLVGLPSLSVCMGRGPTQEIPTRRCSLRLVMLIGGPRDGEAKLWPPSFRWLFPYQGEYVLDFTGVTASWSPCE